MKLVIVDRRWSQFATPFPAAEPVLAELVASLGAGDWTLNLVLLDDAAMADLNARYRREPDVTDVLSFSYLEATPPAECDLAAGVAGARTNLRLPAKGRAAEPPGEPLAGEIVLAPSFVLECCRQEGWDPAVEWAWLVVHGALHVLGWDHAATNDRRAMRAQETAVLAQLGLPHPLSARARRT